MSIFYPSANSKSTFIPARSSWGTSFKMTQWPKKMILLKICCPFCCERWHLTFGTYKSLSKSYLFCHLNLIVALNSAGETQNQNASSPTMESAQAQPKRRSRNGCWIFCVTFMVMCILAVVGVWSWIGVFRLYNLSFSCLLHDKCIVANPFLPKKSAIALATTHSTATDFPETTVTNSNTSHSEFN